MSDNFGQDHSAEPMPPEPPPLVPPVDVVLPAEGPAVTVIPEVIPAADPLSRDEIGSLAGLRAMQAAGAVLSGEEAATLEALAARENVVAPADPLVPDPSEAAAHMQEAFGHVVALLEGIVGAVPMLHNLAGRAAAMATAFERAQFHLAPPPEPTPPSRDPARVAVLQATANRTPAQDAELSALTEGEAPPPSAPEVFTSPVNQRIADLRAMPSRTPAEEAELIALTA